MSAPVNPYAPREIAVRTGPRGPRAVGGRAVEAVREQWLVEDRWWTPKALQRRYFEIVLEGGRNLVVFREPAEPLDVARWFEQRA